MYNKVIYERKQWFGFLRILKFSDHKGNIENLGVGNAVPGVPAGAMREHRARRGGRIAAFGGWNAGDGVPYAIVCAK